MQVWPDVAANPLDHPTTNCFVFINSAYSWRDTGDLVYVEDRRIVYMGRKDNQFKVHGKRLMLEAIESELSSLPHVVQCKYVRTCSRFYLRLVCSRLDLTWRCVRSRVVYDKRNMLSASSASLRAFVVLDEPIDDEGTYPPRSRLCKHRVAPYTQ
jgi:long-subunit acyl-CoA synthetase (AMP-forming)